MNQATHVVVFVQAESGFWLRGEPTMRDVLLYSKVWPELVQFRSFKDINEIMSILRRAK